MVPGRLCIRRAPRLVHIPPMTLMDDVPGRTRDLQPNQRLPFVRGPWGPAGARGGFAMTSWLAGVGHSSTHPEPIDLIISDGRIFNREAASARTHMRAGVSSPVTWSLPDSAISNPAVNRRAARGGTGREGGRKL